MVIRATDNEAIVGEVRQHIEACVAKSEPFDVRRLRFYETVQRDLHNGIGPGHRESEDFPGFEKNGALVIHAEDATTNGLPGFMQLFVPVRDPKVQAFFANDRQVLLYAHAPGSLLNQVPPQSAPLEYVGTVTMINAVPDAPVDVRRATCRIDDLAAPRIDTLPGNTVPPPSGQLSQVVIRLEERGSTDLPVFHTERVWPKARLQVDYRVVDRDEGDQRLVLGPEERREDGLGRRRDDLPEYEVPHHLIVRATLAVPSQDLYREDIQRRLRYLLTGTELFDESTVLELTLEKPRRTTILNRYVYLVNYQLTEESISRIEKQLRLRLK